MQMSSADNPQQLYSPAESGSNTPIVVDQLPKRFSEPFQNCREDHMAIPFIKFHQNEGRFELNPEAEEFLQSLDGVKLGVVAVCGKYRTGKSYLLNKLFVEGTVHNLNSTVCGNERTMMTVEALDTKAQTMSKGFQVSPTINPCTKGLWIWKKVIYSDQNDCPMIVIDTEGLGAFDEDENHDAKIFLLALLMSSLIIYNSVGTIDETALNNLSLVINLSKKIQLKNRQETPEDIDELASIFPTFLWVLRDFSLKLADSDGNRISSKQYLENALKEQKGCSEAVEQKNRIRRMLKHFFQERDCCTLIRPTEKERDLQDLAKLRESHLRKDFVDQMARLKQKVMTKVKVKVMNGHQLNGPMLVELANSYIAALNQGQIPNIENAWSNVCTFEQERTYKESLKHFDQEINAKIKDLDIGFDNVKTLLKEIREQTVQFLKNNFLGDGKALQNVEAKLKSHLKSRSKQVIKEFQTNIDQQITECIKQEFLSRIEQRVRRDDISSIDQLQSEIEDLLLVIQIKFVNDGDRVETLYRKFVQSSVFKVIDALNLAQTQRQQTQLRLLEEKLKLNEQIVNKQKEEKKMMIEEHQYDKDKVELERVELLKREKMLELKMKDMEAKMQEINAKIKVLNTSKEIRDQILQTESQQQIHQTVQCCENPETALPLSSLNKETTESFVQQDDNRQLFTEIIDAINSQKEVLSQTLSQEFGSVLKSNEQLSKAIESAEKRCLLLEKNFEKKKKYETLVKNCQRLQCNGCNKLYTPMLFVNHFVLCKKQQQLRSSIAFDQQSKIQEEDREDSQTLSDDQFLAKIVDMKQVFVDLKEGGVVADDFCAAELSSASEELVNIGRATSPAKATAPGANQYQTVMFKICVLLRGQIWYVHRTLIQVKNLMNRVQRFKENSEGEQCQFAKWLLEIERNEIEENFQRVSEIAEGFFSLVHKKVAEKKVRYYQSKVTVEDIESDTCQQEFIDFFEIKDMYNQGQDDLNVNREPEENDEVIVRLTYDDQDEVKTESDVHLLHGRARCSLVTATIQSGISDLYGGSGALRVHQGFGSSNGNYGANHSTIHLDGEKSANDNSSLHQVSFFSVAEELLMKRNLQMGRGIYGGATLSQLTSQQDDKGDTDCELYSALSKDDNVMTKSPEIGRKCERIPQPFGSISNRPTDLNNDDKSSVSDKRKAVQSPFSCQKVGAPVKKMNGKNMKQAKGMNTAKKQRANGIMYTE